MSIDNDLDDRLDDLFEKGQVSEALALIDRLSLDGDPVACRWRGIFLMGGQHYRRDMAAARHWLGVAADSKDHNALWLEVALSANGSGGFIDWAGALTRLKTLAASDEDARVQADHIGQLDLDSDGYPTRASSSTVFSESPSIQWIEGFCNEYECRQIVASAADMLEGSVIYDPVTGHSRPDPVRTSLAAIVGPTRESIIVAAVLRRIASVSDTPLANGENLSLLRYADGQQYRPHLDAINKTDNQRTTTAILYLNEGYSGGDTVFPAVRISVKPRAGSLLLFDNLLLDGTADRRTLHAGLPVLQGAKWIATRWIRARRYDPWSSEIDGLP